jgi:asparagine synthetase B (glutamine-hydrolysing)
MLSGGLDSVPMTISAALQSDSSVAAFSWVFEEYPESDERRFSSPLCTSLNIPHHHINCDHLWPKFDEGTYVNPVFPFGIPYSEFQQETFRRARGVGVTTLLTGIHGDVLYGYTVGIIYELLRSGRFRMAFKEARALWQRTESKRAFVKHYLIKPLALVQSFLARRNQRRPYPSHCLQDDIAALLVQRSHWLDQESQGALRPQQWRVVLDHFAGEDAAYGRYMDAKFGVERRYPFRDRELCEFILAIPSDQLFANSVTRPIVKRAFQAELTQDILTRNDKTNFSPRIDAGIETDHINTGWFEVEQPAWAQFVKKCYFKANNEQKQRVNVTRWRCGYYDYWKSVCYNRVTKVLGNINSESDNNEIIGS